MNHLQLIGRKHQLLERDVIQNSKILSDIVSGSRFLVIGGSGSIGMAVKQGNTKLLEKVNEFITKMEISGLNDKLREDWDQAVKKKLYDDSMTLDYYLSLD